MPIFSFLNGLFFRNCKSLSSRRDPDDEDGDHEEQEDGAGDVNLLFALLILKFLKSKKIILKFL